MAFLQPLGIEERKPSLPRIYLEESERKWAKEFLKGKGIDERAPILGINPCAEVTMSPDRWVRATQIAAKKLETDQIIISGNLIERSHCEGIASALGANARVIAGEVDIRHLCAIQERLSLFVAPKSSSLNLAAAVGTAVLGIFPQLLSLSSEKWHPLGEKVATIKPFDFTCEKCKEDKCEHFPCVDNIKDDCLKKALATLLD